MRRLLVVCFAVLLFAFMSGPSVLWASDDGFAEKIINSQCKNCHRFEGKPKSKFELKAPDLMWGGVKFQRRLVDPPTDGTGRQSLPQQLSLGQVYFFRQAHGIDEGRSYGYRWLYGKDLS